MNLTFWPGAVAMVLLATMTAALVSYLGTLAWFVGTLIIIVYLMLHHPLSLAAEGELIGLGIVCGHDQ